MQASTAAEPELPLHLAPAALTTSPAMQQRSLGSPRSFTAPKRRLSVASALQHLGHTSYALKSAFSEEQQSRRHTFQPVVQFWPFASIARSRYYIPILFFIGILFVGLLYLGPIVPEAPSVVTSFAAFCLVALAALLGFAAADSNILLNHVLFQFDYLYLNANALLHAVGNAWALFANPEFQGFDPQFGTAIAVFGIVVGASIVVVMQFITLLDAWMVSRRAKSVILVLYIARFLWLLVQISTEVGVANNPICMYNYCLNHRQLRMATISTITTFGARYLLRSWWNPGEFVVVKSGVRFELMLPAATAAVSASASATAGAAGVDEKNREDLSSDDAILFNAFGADIGLGSGVVDHDDGEAEEDAGGAEEKEREQDGSARDGDIGPVAKRSLKLMQYQGAARSVDSAVELVQLSPKASRVP